MSTHVLEPELDNDDIGDLVTAGTVVGMGAMAFIVGGSLAMGFATGLGAAVFSGIILWKTRTYQPRLWNTMMKYPLATDICVSGFFITTIGSMTAMGLVAGIVASGLVTVGIGFANKYVGEVQNCNAYNFNLFNKFKTKKEIKHDEQQCEVATV